jgi:hypothetical protein
MAAALEADSRGAGKSAVMTAEAVTSEDETRRNKNWVGWRLLHPG